MLRLHVPLGYSLNSEALERIVEAVRAAVFLPLPAAAHSTVLPPEALKHTAGILLILVHMETCC